MDMSEWVTLFSLAVSATALVGAAFLYLARETRAVPKRRRVAAMAGVAWGTARRRFPSRHKVAVMAAGIGGFLAGGLICAVGCYAILLWYASTLPQDENVIAGAAQAELLMLHAAFGVGLSFVAGLVSGIASGLYVNGRMSHRGCS